MLKFHIFVCDEFLELNKEKIKNDNSLINGETYFLPYLACDTIEQVEIQDSIKTFAELNNLQFADTIKDNKLENAVVYLISG